MRARQAEVLEPVQAEVAQAHAVRKCIGQQLGRDSGHQDLTAVRDRLKPRRPVDDRTEVVTVAFFAHPRVHAHSDPDRLARRPVFSGQSTLCSHSSLCGKRGCIEGGAECVADGLEDVAGGILNRAAHDRVVPAQGGCHLLRLGLP